MRVNVRSEDGFTIVETVVAAILLAIGAIAVLGAFDGATRATFRAEQSQVASDIAQREVEALRAKPYTQLALTSAPATSGDSDSPAWRVVGSNFALNDDRTNQSPLVVQGGSLTGGGTITGASVAPTTAFDSGDISGTIRRYVVWRNDPNCADVLCTGSQDYKRVVVAVELDSVGTGSGSPYVEVQSDVIDPERLGRVEPQPAAARNPDGRAAVLALRRALPADRRPDPRGDAEQPRAAPDLPGEPEHLRGHQPEPPRRADDHRAAQQPRQQRRHRRLRQRPRAHARRRPTPACSSCSPTRTGARCSRAGANGYKQQHVWVTRRLNTSAAYALTGGATLKLWTRTINDIATAGKLCVIVFRRTETESGGTITGVTDSVITTVQPSYGDLAAAAPGASSRSRCRSAR